MQYQDNSKKIYLKVLWILLGVGLNTLEIFIPRIPFLPWLKPGLANCITILWIIKFGIKDAVLYSLLRVWISSFYFGFSLITFTLAFSGGVLSTIAMGVLWKSSGKRNFFGTIGIAIIGAIVHNTGQLLCVYLIFVKNSVIFYQLPFMCIASLIFGSINGFLAPVISNVTDENIKSLNEDFFKLSFGTYKKSEIFLSGLIIIFCFLLVGVSNLLILFTFSFFITLLAFWQSFFSIKILFYPLKFKFIFILTVFIYLFFSYGKRIPFIPFLTYEGVRETVEQSLRLWSWIEAGLLLQKLNFNRIFFELLRRFFPSSSSTIFAGLIAIELFPDVISFAGKKEAQKGISKKKLLLSIKIFITNLENYISEIIVKREMKN